MAARIVSRIPSLLFALVFAGAALAQKAPVYSDSSGAIRGYDPVAYFTQGRPVKGSPELTHQWKGATWRFASAENRERFAAAPEKYAPQYGGYCAYGVASGYAVKIEPDAWSVVDGKLYLNYDRSVQKSWQSDVPGYIRKADVNWPRVLER
jgi:YHS domain-containing protein